MGPEPGEVGQGGLKVHPLMTSLPKNPHPPAKKIFRVRTIRLAESFEPFTRSVALIGLEKFPRKAMCDAAVFARIS